MSECANGELRDLLPELVNGQLDAEMQATVEAHVGSCTECANELALLRSLRPALLHVPAIDTQRIAAAVRARTAGGAARAPSRAGVAPRWRIAIAAATLLAVSALGYVLGTHRASGIPEIAVVPTTRQSIAPDSGSRTRVVPESAHASHVVPPRTAPVHAPQQQVAVAPPHVTAPGTSPSVVAGTGVLDNVSDLSDDDVRTLTASLDKLPAIPNADASPDIDPLGASLDDASAGGR